MAKACDLAKLLGVPDGQFKISTGWLKRLERQGISFKKVRGEEKSVDLTSYQMEE